MINVMEHKGFSAKIMEAPRLTGEGVHDLPPGTPLEVYPADLFMKLPESWMKGPGVFIIPVRPNKGLWFDWRGNSEINTAVIPTIKGCNPITGMQTSGFHLEKYETKCPKHGCDFLAERFCPECNYKWPDRNYVSMSPSWWDGFRAEDGTVRQFFFSEDELRDIATALIGKENTVPAFGFAFYSPKERRPEASITRNVINTGYLKIYDDIQTEPWYGIYGSGSAVGDSAGWFSTNTTEGQTKGSGSLKSSRIFVSNCSLGHGEVHCMDSASIMFSAPVEVKTSGTPPVSGSKTFSKGLAASQKQNQVRSRQVVKEVSIGAGAKIRQALNNDSYSLDSWKEAPDSVMTIYFVFQEKLEELKAGGMRDLSGVPEGMLEGLPVG